MKNTDKTSGFLRTAFQNLRLLRGTCDYCGDEWEGTCWQDTKQPGKQFCSLSCLIRYIVHQEMENKHGK